MNRSLESNFKFNEDQSVRFLLSEYEQCFEQMRHHNNISISLIKFTFTGFVAVFSGSFALFKYLTGEDYQEIIVGCVLLLSFVAGIVALIMILRNRLYFIVVSRQTNSLRNYFLNNMMFDYIKYNICYLNPDYPPAFNPKSSYTLQLLIVALINGIIGGVGFYFVIRYFFNLANPLILAIAISISIVLVIIQTVVTVSYLKRSDSKKIINMPVANNESLKNDT